MHQDEFATEAVAYLSRRFEGIPGVRVTSADADPSSTLITVWGTGWSPTLHMIKTIWDFDVGVMARHPQCLVPNAVARVNARDPSVVADLLRPETMIAPSMHVRNGAGEVAVMAARQWRRADAASRLGHEVALPNGTAEPTIADLKRMAVGHVMVDRALISLIRAGAGNAEDAAHGILRLLCEAHAGEMVDADDAMWMGEMTTELDDGDGVPRMRMEAVIDGDATFDGRDVVIEETLPASVMTAMTGRPLADVVSTGTVLDARTIASCERGHMETKIRLEHDDVSLASIQEHLN